MSEDLIELPYFDKVLQVCTSCGDVKKGKSNTFGIYLIHRMTFFGNYLACGYLIQITKKIYDKQFELVYKMLKTD